MTSLLRATAVTRGWNGYRNKSQHRKSTLEKKILPPLLQGFEPVTFRSWVRRSNHWAIPAPLSKCLFMTYFYSSCTILMRDRYSPNWPCCLIVLTFSLKHAPVSWQQRSVALPSLSLSSTALISSYILLAGKDLQMPSCNKKWERPRNL